MEPPAGQGASVRPVPASGVHRTLTGFTTSSFGELVRSLVTLTELRVPSVRIVNGLCSCPAELCHVDPKWPLAQLLTEATLPLVGGAVKEPQGDVSPLTPSLTSWHRLRATLEAKQAQSHRHCAHKGRKAPGRGKCLACGMPGAEGPVPVTCPPLEPAFLLPVQGSLGESEAESDLLLRVS